MARNLKTTTVMGLALASVSMPALGSSHREAPGITETAKVDNTDVYVFRSYEPGRDGTITLIANFQPAQTPGDGPNYFTMDPDALYEIHIDNSGDAVDDMTFQFRFANTLVGGVGKTVPVGGVNQPIPLRHVGPIAGPGDANQGELETYTVGMVMGGRGSDLALLRNADGSGSTFNKPIDNIGNKTTANYPDYANQFIYNVLIPGCSSQGRVFAGQREEAFAVNTGPIFDLVNLVPIEGDSKPGADDSRGFPGGITQSDKNQQLIGQKNVTSLALEIPTACLTGTGNGVIGVWSSASLPLGKVAGPRSGRNPAARIGGDYKQVSRLGAPLVNEVVIGLPQKDLFNASKPTQDATFATYVTNPAMPAILNTLFLAPVNAALRAKLTDLAPSNFPRRDLVAAYLTGFPNLNQLKTVTPSEMLRLNTGVPVTLRDRQSSFGVAGDDLAGFPNGRRPGDDVVDITLRVAMGRLCHPVPLKGEMTDLGLCRPTDAPTGTVDYTDGAPSSAKSLLNSFPYLNPPLRGAPRPQTKP